MSENAMVRHGTSECYGEGVLWPPQRTMRVLALAATIPCQGIFASADDMPATARPRLRRCKTQQNLTSASLPQIRRNVVRAWRLMLAQRTVEAQETIERIELQLDDVSGAAAKSLNRATQLLRAVGLALQDDSLAALVIAISHLNESSAERDDCAASTLCRLGLWQLDKLEAFHALPRHQPWMRRSRWQAVSAFVDLSIEAAVALDHLNMTAAKRLAADALALADTTRGASGLAALPACLVAQVLYEEGNLDAANAMLCDRLPAINAEGSIECAVRAYLLLARIARHQGNCDLASILLHEADALGQRRQWPRLLAASMAERVSLLLEVGRTKEARLRVDRLDRQTELHRVCSGRSGAEVAQYRTLARWRVAWVESRSEEAVAALRQQYNDLIDRHDLYAACRLAVELAGMLASIGEVVEADELFFHTMRLGAASGLYQVFLEGRRGSETLLRRVYDRVSATAAERPLLPFVGSLLSGLEKPHAERGRLRPAGGTGDTLTVRECEILTRIGEGLPNKRVARALDISPETVKSHVKRIFEKLAVSTRAEAVSRGKSLGLL